MADRIHAHLIDQIALSLERIFFQEAHAEKVVDWNLKHHRKWGSRDRRFFAETVYEIVRWWRLYWHLIDTQAASDLPLIKKIIAAHFVIQKTLAEEQLAAFDINPEKIRARKKELEETPSNAETLSLKHSIPVWMCNWGFQELAEQWPKYLQFLNQKAPLDLRTNRLHGSAQELRKKLQSEGIETDLVSGFEDLLTLKIRQNVFLSESYKKGLFEMQDRASQLVAPFLQPEPGSRIVDACAGSGGKSLHLAALMKNKGKIISLDIHQWKLTALVERARRNRIDIIETRMIESTKVIKRLAETADRLLLDVPCSGMGVLRRHPDTKWKLSPDKLVEIRKQQAQILASYSQIVKTGGKLVYATCSMMKSENEEIVESFVKQNSKFRIEDMKRTHLDAQTGDGFFMCRMEKN